MVAGRNGHDALVAQVRAGVTHIIVWHVGRLYRQPRELEDLIDLVEQHPVRNEAVRGGGFDLNTTEGRLMAPPAPRDRCVRVRTQVRPRRTRQQAHRQADLLLQRECQLPHLLDERDRLRVVSHGRRTQAPEVRL
ncbi:recombinase family protein [Microbacterium paludicola]|uniref:recombinase family protein n=1 Tax=Microbacterium paludicola TaxID=300019 RepID=UPI0037C9C544